jgi:hypothetical protein
MANWRSPGRAERVVIYEEAGGPRQYWRGEDEDGNAVWCEQEPSEGRRRSGGEMTTAELLKAIEASLLERRRAGRGRTFRL